MVNRWLVGILVFTTVLAIVPGSSDSVPAYQPTTVSAFNEMTETISEMAVPEEAELTEKIVLPKAAELPIEAELPQEVEALQEVEPSQDADPTQEAEPPVTTIPILKNDIVNINQTYTYEIMTQDIQKLAQAYPDLVEYKSLGTTKYNREIWAIKLGKGSPSVFFNGAHHAREWAATSICMYMIDRYAYAYSNNQNFDEYETQDILDKISIWFVPMVNPDGVTLQQEGLKAFPEEVHEALLEMNRGSYQFSSWKANLEGIDLNRQYPADWENIVSNVPQPFYQNHKGLEPLSATEAKILADFTYRIDPEITVSYHDSGRILFWHFHNRPENLSRDRTLANELYNLTGYTPVPPEPNPSGGGYKDWFIQEFGRPGFTLEIGEYANEKNVPFSALAEEWERNRKVGLNIANEGFTLWLRKNRSGDR